MYVVPRAANQHSVIRLASLCEVEIVAGFLNLGLLQLQGIWKKLSFVGEFYLVRDSEDEFSGQHFSDQRLSSI